MNRSDKTVKYRPKGAGELGRGRARFGALAAPNVPNTEFAKKNGNRAQEACWLMESVYVFAFHLGPTNVSLKFQGDVFIFKVFILGDM